MRRFIASELEQIYEWLEAFSKQTFTYCVDGMASACVLRW
jgi:hypothetical protein